MGIHSRGGCRRQASEQYFTSAQFLAHRLRQVIGRRQVAQGLLGRERLLPLNEGAAGIMHHCSQGARVGFAGGAQAQEDAAASDRGGNDDRVLAGAEAGEDGGVW